VNADATYNKQERKAGMGVNIHDSARQVIACFARKIKVVHDSNIAEALALKWAITVTHETGIHGGFFETDCLEVILAVNEPEDIVMELDVLASDLRIRSQILHLFYLSYVNRAANTAAHCLPKYGLTCCELQLWMKKHPFSSKIV